MAKLPRLKAGFARLVEPCTRALERARWGSYYAGLHNNLDPDLHIREAAEWLMRAQDAGSDRGVSYGAVFGKGFAPSYPETTGYIICTFLDLAEFYADDRYLQRALEAADWEIAVQMPSGAVMGGVFNTNPTPAVFNTGQVLLGWAALLRKTGHKRFAEAGHRAAAWLVSMQEENGCWIRGNSAHANPHTTVYNVMAAWGLAEFGRAAGDEQALSAATRNAEYALSRQTDNGWFADCCLNDAARPLLHTLGYTMQGLVGIGRLTGRQDLIQSASRTADSLLQLMDVDGFIPGRLDRNMRPAAAWACLTGTAQTSSVWSELFRCSGDQRYREAVSRANRYLMARHDVSNRDPVIRGGVAGSWPVWGDYGRLMVLNWAAKFFVDALLAEKSLAAADVLV